MSVQVKDLVTRSRARTFYGASIALTAMSALLLKAATPLGDRTYLNLAPVAFMFGGLVAAKASGLFSDERRVLRRMAWITPAYLICAVAFAIVELMRWPEASWPFVLGLYVASGLLLIPAVAVMSLFLGEPRRP